MVDDISASALLGLAGGGSTGGLKLAVQISTSTFSLAIGGEGLAAKIGASAFFGGGNGLEQCTSSGSWSGLLLISVNGEIGLAVEIGASTFFGGGNQLELCTSSGSWSGLLLISVSRELGLAVEIGASTFFGGGNGIELCTSSGIQSGLLLILVSGENGLAVEIGASTFFGGGNGLELFTSSGIRTGLLLISACSFRLLFHLRRLEPIFLLKRHLCISVLFLFPNLLFLASSSLSFSSSSPLP